MRWAYSTMLPSPHGAKDQAIYTIKLNASQTDTDNSPTSATTTPADSITCHMAKQPDEQM